MYWKTDIYLPRQALNKGQFLRSRSILAHTAFTKIFFVIILSKGKTYNTRPKQVYLWRIIVYRRLWFVFCITKNTIYLFPIMYICICHALVEIHKTTTARETTHSYYTTFNIFSFRYRHYRSSGAYLRTQLTIYVCRCFIANWVARCIWWTCKIVKLILNNSYHSMESRRSYFFTIARQFLLDSLRSVFRRVACNAKIPSLS